MTLDVVQSPIAGTEKADLEIMPDEWEEEEPTIAHGSPLWKVGCWNHSALGLGSMWVSLHPKGVG